MKLDILAIGVHPDDVELGCSGTLIKHINKGQEVGILDLTEGELGSRGTVETRYEEAAEAAKLMGVNIRHNLQMQDGLFENNFEHQLKIIRIIRQYQPEIVLANALHDRHPDHGRASELIKTACFLSGLRKIESRDDQGNEQLHWRPLKIYHYIQDRLIHPDFVVDISDVMEQKMNAIRCYKTQFLGEGNEPATYISHPGFLKHVESRATTFGHEIGVAYGEGFNTQSIPGISYLDDFMSSKRV